MKFGAKEWLALLLSILFLTDLIIFLNIPILRQVSAFLCFTIIPGLLILHILKLNKIESLKKFVLSIGLSIAFLMFVGLLLNQLYLAIGISKPLSTSSLVISFTVILVILAFIAYKRNKDDFNFSEVLNSKPKIENDQLVSPLFFSLIFPFLAVFGTYLMNMEGNNIILMIMLLLIPIYVIFIVYLRNRIPKITYPIAILMIGVALTLTHGLTSNYLNGRDVQGEYYAFRIVASNLCWSMSNFNHVLTACLSTSILPTIYWSLSGVDKIYVYKLLYQIIWAFTPLVCYIMFKKYVNELYAFLASIFYMSQMCFIFELQSAMRTELAILFFAFSMMVFFDDEIDNLSKRILFLVFIFAVIVSHYSTSYILFIMVFSLWLITLLMKNYFKSKYVISATIIMLFFAVIFFWYSQVTNTAFNSFVDFTKSTITNLGNFFQEDIRQEQMMSSLTGQEELLPNKISFFVHWTTFIFIFFGIINLIKDYKNKRSRIELEYLLAIVISAGMLLSTIIIPYVSIGYGGRAYSQFLVFLALGFVVGGKTICRYARRPQFSLLVIMIVLISQFFCATYVVHQVLDVPWSEDLNRAGHKHGALYIYDQEVISAKWLDEYNINYLRVYTDSYGYTRLWTGCKVGKLPAVVGIFFKNNKTIDKGYIYLRHENIVNGKIYTTGYYKYIKPITDYSHLFAGKSKIYNNGGSEIWK